MNDFQELLRQMVGKETRNIQAEAVESEKKRLLLESESLQRLERDWGPAPASASIEKGTPKLGKTGQGDLQQRLTSGNDRATAENEVLKDPKNLFLQFLSEFGNVVQKYKAEFEVEIKGAEDALTKMPAAAATGAWARTWVSPHHTGILMRGR